MSNDPTLPTYRTNRVYTRNGLREFFQTQWSDHRVTYEDVHRFVGGQAVYGHLPYPLYPEKLSDEESQYGDIERHSAWNKHETDRNETRRARELFDIAGMPVFVPSNLYPAAGDSESVRERKQDRINALRTTDINEEN